MISAASRRSNSTCSAIFAESWSRTISSTDRLLGAAADPGGMHEALALLGRLRRERVARQRGDEVCGELDRVDELPLRGAGMRRAAADRDDDLRRVERLGLDLAGRGAVERVRELGSEALQVEVLGSARDLLVDREADADRRVRQPGFRFRYATAAMISATPALSSAPSRVVPSRGDEVVADLPREQGQLCRDRARRADRRAARSGRRRSRGEPAGRLRSRSRRATCRRGRSADRRRGLRACERAVDVAVLVEADVVEPDLLQLVAEQAREIELLLGRRRGCRRRRFDWVSMRT